MTITLTHGTEAMLLAVAAQRGLAPDEALNVLLAEAATDFEEAVAGIQRGMDDFAAGRWISLEEFTAKAQTTRPIAQ